MDKSQIVYWLSWLGVTCWPVCFIWMFRISRNQNALLTQIREQGARIEKLSRAEHDLIREVHPQVPKIRKDMSKILSALDADDIGVGLDEDEEKRDGAKFQPTT